MRPPLGMFQIYLFLGLAIATVVTTLSVYDFLIDDSFANTFSFVAAAFHLLIFSILASATKAVERRLPHSQIMIEGLLLATLLGYCTILFLESYRQEPLPSLLINNDVQMAVVILPIAIEAILLRKFRKKLAELRAASEAE
jgi:hypothetical protein